MIDLATARLTTNQLQIGELVEYIIDGIAYNRPLVDKTEFSITVQGPTNKLTLPVELTAIYQKDAINMARSPLPPDTTARRRGRPPKGENVAPVTMPTPPAYLPPGSGYTGPVQQSPGQFQQASQEQPQPRQSAMDANGNIVRPGLIGATLSPEKIAEQQAKNIPIEAAEGNENWAIEAFDEAIGELRDTIGTIIANLQDEADKVSVAAPEPHLKTCYDCVNVDMDNNICGMFKVAPPMNVQCDAKTNCQSFVDCEVIPY